MAVERIIVLSVLITQTLSAPSGCIESCNFYQTSHQSHRASGGYQDHAGLVEGSTHLNDHDYAKPGNWTEHNQFDTEGGHGKVHEERGQYVEGSKRVRYYKKNYTSSYGNINGLDATELGDLSAQRRYDSLRIPSSQYLDSQSTYGQSGQTVQETGYNTMHSQQTQSSSSSSSTRIDSKNERLEDFGDYSGHSQVNQQHVPTNVNTQTIDTQHHIETAPRNWSRVDSYRTDGGHGRVFEEEGQYVTGPKKVRYFKKNYTSSYSTSGVPQTNIGSTKLSELHNELQRNVQRELDNVRREFHESSSSGHTASSVGLMDLSQETVGFHNNDLQTAESDTYTQLGIRPTVRGFVRHYTDQQHRETYTDTRQPLTHTYPSTYDTDSQRTYQSHQTYTSQARPVSQSTHYASVPDQIQFPARRDYHQTSLQNAHSSSNHDEIQRTEVFGSHQQSGVAQNQLLTDTTQQVYNPSYGTYPSRHGESRHYEEHWSSSSHSGGHVAPERPADYVHGTEHAGRTHYDRDAYNEHRGRHHTAQGYDSHAAHASESSYNSAFRTSSGKHVTGSLDLSHVAPGAADCTEETQQYQQQTRYHRKYKRDDHHVQQHQTAENQMLSQIADQQSEDLTQQTQGSDDLTQQTSGKLEFGQQLEDLTQQTEGHLEFGQQTVGNQHLEDLTQQSEQFTQQTQGSHDDLTQQTSGKLEFGQQTVDGQQLEDLTQQTQGHLEFGKQTVGDQHLEDLTQQSEQFTQQTQGSHDDLTQQTSGKLEFGQQTDSQQFEDLTQQTQGHLEFGQQTVGNQHLEDLTQQSEQFTQQTQGSHDDLMQQTSGKLEFGQQTVDGQQLEDLTQQTQGQLEFGQQTVGDQHLEDLTQQSEQFTHQTQGSHDDLMQQTSGKLEFGQQTIDNHHLEDFTQQTEGQLEFGQQNDDKQLEKLLQRTEKLEQRTPRSNGLAQQTVDKIEIGHHSNQHLEDLTQQNEQFAEQMQGSNYFTQQTSGKLTFGQQTVGGHQSEDLTQNSDEQFTQQTEGQLEFGQHSVGNQHLEDLTQKNEQFANDFTQQTMGHIQFGRPEVEDLTQQENEDLTQQTGGFDDFTHQTSGRLEQQQEQQRRPSWSEYNTQHMGQFSQQTDWNADILPHQRPSHTNNKPSDQWQLEQMSQQTDFDRDFTQQTDHQSAPKPAPKPKPRPRYHQHAYIPSEKDTNVDNTYKPIEVHSEPDIDTPERTSSTSDYPRSQVVYSQSPGSSVYNNGEENLDRLHWIHKSNDASVGLQWHYTYHPSDLINVEGTYYGPNINPTSQQTQETQHQSRGFDFSQQETQDKHVFEQNQQLGSSQQIETSHSKNQFNQNSEEIPARVIPLQNSQQTTELDKQRMQVTGQTEEPQIEPRILQAFGGGPYDPSHTDDIYNRVTINPSATLPPIYSDDPWDIREKPKEMIPWVVAHKMSTENTPKPIDTTTSPVETTTPITETTTASFWNRLGKRITTTYGKAKERAKEIFG